MRLVGLVVCLTSCAFLQSLTGAETYVTRTNWVDTAITNIVEVRMPRNIFVNEYHTNWVERVHTNLVARELPRKVTVDFVHTNVITHYSTNYINKSEERTVYIDLVSTNFVDHFRTNMKVLHFTNEIAVDRYRTNWQTLNFTNFQTVLVMKTNWVTQLVTNVVQLDLPAKSPPSSPTVAAKPDRPALKTPLGAADGPILEGSKTSTQPDNNLVEVLLRVRWPETADARPIQQWKVEREDGTFMCVGQEQTFKKELPIGSYKIEVTLKSAPSAQVLRGALVITPNEVVVRQKPSGKKLVSANN
jgi:hypothetical protein